jgi:hypothetical protein
LKEEIFSRTCFPLTKKKSKKKVIFHINQKGTTSTQTFLIVLYTFFVSKDLMLYVVLVVEEPKKMLKHGKTLCFFFNFQYAHRVKKAFDTSTIEVNSSNKSKTNNSSLEKIIFSVFNLLFHVIQQKKYILLLL